MRRLIRNKRGMSAVIGAIFTVIVFLAGFYFILWEVGMYDSHQQVINERNRLDQARNNEILEILNPYIESSRLIFSVTNKGAVTGHVVSIWYTEYNGTTPLRQIGPNTDDTYINSGATLLFNVTFAGINPELSYLIKIVTERGNEVTKRLDPLVAAGTAGNLNVGPFVLIFSGDSFRYTSDNTSPMPDVINPISAFEMDNDNRYIIFHIKIKNQGGDSIQISSLSFFQVVVRELGSGGVPGNVEDERYFHIVSNSSTYSNLVAYSDSTPLLIASGETATLKFGAQSVGGTAFLNYPLRNSGTAGHDTYTNLLWTYLVLFWNYQGTEYRYGQTIAYTAIKATP